MSICVHDFTSVSVHLGDIELWMLKCYMQSRGCAHSLYKGAGGYSCEITKDTCSQCNIHQGTDLFTVRKQGSGQEKWMALRTPR